MSKPKATPAEIIRGMESWYSEKEVIRFTFPDMRSRSPGERTRDQRIWDHAIFTASEFVRRREGHNEGISGEILGLLSDHLPRKEGSGS